MQNGKQIHIFVNKRKIPLNVSSILYVLMKGNTAMLRAPFLYPRNS